MDIRTDGHEKINEEYMYVLPYQAADTCYRVSQMQRQSDHI